MQQLVNQIRYRKATFDDAKIIKSLLVHAFKNNEGLFLPLKPTEHNATVFYMTEIRPIIINDDPCLIAFDGEREVALSCCSTGVNNAYDLTKRIALGGITVTKKQYRRQGIADQLRKAMLSLLKEKNIDFVLSDISKSNIPSEKGCKRIVKEKALSFNEISVKYECEI